MKDKSWIQFIEFIRANIPHLKIYNWQKLKSRVRISISELQHSLHHLMYF